MTDSIQFNPLSDYIQVLLAKHELMTDTGDIRIDI